MADVPGLIPGASQGKGLGLDFLRHIERCSVLVHVVDCATFEPGRDPVSDVDALEEELARYTPALGGSLASRPRVVVLNKMDVPDARELADIVAAEFDARAACRCSRSRRRAARACASCRSRWPRSSRRTARAGRPWSRPRIVLRPRAVDDGGLHGRRATRRSRAGSSSAASVRSAGSGRPRSTTTRPSATSADRLARLGVEEALAEAGATPGCPVTIGDVTFDWEPSTPAGVAVLLHERGTTPGWSATTASAPPSARRPSMPAALQAAPTARRPNTWRRAAVSAASRWRGVTAGGGTGPVRGRRG